MSDDRSERLRDKRNRSKKKVQSRASEVDEQEKAEKTSKPSKLSQTGEPSETDGADEKSVKDEQVGTYLYLPEGQRDEMKYQYKMLSAEYERKFGDELEKNRHYYPLLIEYGLDSLSDWDVQEVRNRLSKLNY